MRISSIAAFSILAWSPSSVVAFAPSSFSSLRGTVTSTRPTSSLFGYIDVAESTQRDLEPFQEWAAQCGVQRIEGFQLTTEDGLDFSVITTDDLPAGQTILAVPANMILSASGCKQELLAMSNGGVKDAVETMGRIGAGLSVPEFYLILKLLVEFEKGDQSDYFPWLNSLPRLYYNAVSMTDFCYECLPPLVFNLSRAERLKFDNFMQVLAKVDVISDDLKQEREILKWAFNAVHTRCWGEAGQDQFIVPMADMFNHGTETEVEIAFDEEGNCQAYTTTDVPAGSPLRMSYGCPTNPSAFFARYGFLDESSPATFCKMMNIQSTPQLVDIGYDFSRMLFYKDTGEISEEVWDVVLYSKVLARKPDVQKQFYDAHMAGDADAKAAIHQQFFLETTTEVKTHVDTFLKQLDDLSNKAVGKDINEHPRLPLILRHNDFVRNTFVNVKSNLDPMVAQASEERALA